MIRLCRTRKISRFIPLTRSLSVAIKMKTFEKCFVVVLIFSDTTQLLTTSNFIGPWYHAALLFLGLGSIVLLFVLLFSHQIREDLVRAAYCHFFFAFEILKCDHNQMKDTEQYFGK